jgi:hypothetical protein
MSSALDDAPVSTFASQRAVSAEQQQRQAREHEKRVKQMQWEQELKAAAVALQQQGGGAGVQSSPTNAYAQSSLADERSSRRAEAGRLA